jgi:Domain of unknown function (DUF4149)
MTYRISLLVVTLWVGALWMTGIAAYTLFQHLADKQLAGSLAGHLFTVVSYIGLVSAIWLLITRLLSHGTGALKQSFFWIVLAMLFLVLAGHFGIQPLLAKLKASALPVDVMHSVFADRFKTWHGIASVAYLIECVLGAFLVFKVRQ